MSLVYVAAPYRGKTREDVEQNIAQARKIAIAVWEAGHVAITPNLNTALFEYDCSCTDEQYLQGDLEILARCDVIVLSPDWERSIGARGEYQFARERGIPSYVYPELPALHPAKQHSRKEK